MMLLAPTLFSMITLWRIDSAIFSPMVRAITSFPPPAAVGTMIRMVRDGKFCACAPGLAAATAPYTAERENCLLVHAMVCILFLSSVWLRLCF